MATITYFEVSGKDALLYDCTLTNEETEAAIETGTVRAVIVEFGTATPIIEGAAAIQALTHQGEGQWTGVHAAADVATAIAALQEGDPFDICIEVQGQAMRRIKRCKKVAVTS